MKQKLLIIGAGVEQIPAIVEAKKMGHKVIVSDMSDKAPGIKYADKFYKISTTDKNGNLNIAKKEKIDGVLTVCSETAVPTVAYVAQQLGLYGYNEFTANVATNKALMREVLTKHEVPFSPFIVAREFEEVTEFCSRIGGPWVVKPVDSSGQRGTTLIYSFDKLQEAFFLAKKYSKVQQVLVDKYLQGPEVHVTMQVIDGQPHILAISDRITLNRENFGIAVRHLGPSELPTELEEEIKNVCSKSINAIKLKDGVATCELIIQDNKPFLMEIAIRVPGGYLREVAMLLSGIDIVKTTIWTALGKKLSLEQMKTEDKYKAVSVKFISENNLDKSLKVVHEISNADASLYNNVKLINFHFSVPFEVPPLRSSVGRFGVIIAVGDSRAEAIRNSEEAFNNIKLNGTNLIEYVNYNENNVDFKKLLK